MALVTIAKYRPEENSEGGKWLCEQLEEGNVLYFPDSPFKLPQEDLDFLLHQRQSDVAYHKNIAYRPAEDRITGVEQGHGRKNAQLLQIMRQYSHDVTSFVATLLTPYANSWRLDYATFRSKEEEGRSVRLRARNDLLHVDSFPTRPTNGDRILRVFTNVNPSKSRRWITTDTFDVLVKQFAGSAIPLPVSLDRSLWRYLCHKAAKAVRALGLPIVPRSPYDDFMLRFHHFLKENQQFQESCPKTEWAFSPHSTWLVFTDMVPHAVLSGQYALEQTYIVSRHALVSPCRAPVNILEDLCGARIC